MKKARIFTDKEVEKIITDYENGIGLCELSKNFHVRPENIKKVLISKNIHIRTISEQKQKVTNEMIENFISAYVNEKLTIPEISRKYKVSISTICRYFNENGIITHGKSISKETEEKIVKLYKSGLSENEIYKITGNIPRTITNALKRNNIHIRDNTEYRTYSVDETYFDNIDTQNKAYVLGLLYADGNVSKIKYRLQLSLQERDKHILEQIRNDMKSERPLTFRQFNKYNSNRQNHYSLDINCKKIHSSLAQWGIVPKKTHVLKYPNFLQDDMHRHFIRGVLDGDGCIHPPYGKNGKIKSVDICGTYDFCCGLKDIIESILNIHCSVIKTSADPNRTTYRVTISSGIQVSKFLSWIYNDANLYLYRKYDIFQKYYNVKAA